jgi:hypothetical protein
MPQPTNDADGDELSQGRFDPGQRRRMRQMQRRTIARIRAAEAQEVAARATERNARYMLWSVIIAVASAILSAAAAVLSIFANLPHASH